MYINPIDKPPVPPSHKSKKAAGKSSFQEEIDTLLVDAVDIASPKKEGEQHKDLHSSLQREKKDESQSDEILAGNKGEKSLNIRA